MNSKIPILKKIQNQMILSPVYTTPNDRINYHQDRYDGKPELVGNYYVGSTQDLLIKSKDGRFEIALKCREGTIRIFQPIMNLLLFHAKFFKFSKTPHYCLTLRTSKKNSSSYGYTMSTKNREVYR